MKMKEINNWTNEKRKKEREKERKKERKKEIKKERKRESIRIFLSEGNWAEYIKN